MWCARDAFAAQAFSRMREDVGGMGGSAGVAAAAAAVAVGAGIAAHRAEDAL